MIIYKDIISGDEMFSDIYKITEREDGLIQVEGKYICRQIQDIDDRLIGGNASAEEICEGTDSASEQGIDFKVNHKLVLLDPYDKKGYGLYLKGYIKNLRKKIEELNHDNPNKDEKMAQYEKDIKVSATALCNFVKHYKEDLIYFAGESSDVDGMVGVVYHDADDTPFMLCIKCGLEIEKC